MESPTAPMSTTTFVAHDSDDNNSMVTVVTSSINNNNNNEQILYLNPTSSDDLIDSSDYINANSTSQQRTLQTIVEVVNPILIGDGSATEIAVARMTNDDLSLPSFNVDDNEVGMMAEEEEEELELSLNDKMKNVLKELKENEKVRLNWSRSMEDEEMEVTDETDGVETYEEKTGSIGTVFMVRERLINDFYDHEKVAHQQQENIDSCQVISNPNVDEFLAHEIRHAESLTLDLRTPTATTIMTTTANDGEDDDEDDEDDTTTTENTPTTPSKTLEATITSTVAAAAGNKKRRRNKKNKAKK